MLSAIVSLSLASLSALAVPSRRSSPTVGSANSTIAWSLCPDTANDAYNTTFYCASHKVPLNWVDPSDGNQADLYLRMLPVAEGVERRGSLFIESGGPGGSNTQWVLDVGGLANSLSGGVYDIVGLDPRGVNLTSPNLRAQDSDYKLDLFDIANPQLVLTHDPTVPFDGSDSHAAATDRANFDSMDRRADLVVRAIEQRTTEQERKSISTAFDARDMAAVVDALGEADGLLNYYGVSYGTVLGVTFAAMFPDKVGRMLLDGVVDSNAYYHDWQKFVEVSVVASDDVSHEFSRLCAQAGPDRCALASNDTSLSSDQAVQAVDARVRGVVSQAYNSPLPVLADQDGYSSFVTGADVYLLYRSALYDPSTWSTLAKVFASASSGDGTVLRAAVPLPGSLIRGDRSLATENVLNRTTENTDGTEVTQSIMCGDQSAELLAELKNSTNDWWVQYADKVRKEGWTTTEYLLNLLHGCRSYQSVSYERYNGTFSVADGLRPPLNKLLFVGNTHDPITPLSGARTMSKGFEDHASLLVHDARGHTTLTERSNCTFAAMGAYLVDGTLPAYGTICKADETLVFPASAATADPSTLSTSPEGGNLTRRDFDRLDSRMPSVKRVFGL